MTAALPEGDTSRDGHREDGMEVSGLDNTGALAAHIPATVSPPRPPPPRPIRGLKHRADNRRAVSQHHRCLRAQGGRGIRWGTHTRHAGG